MFGEIGIDKLLMLLVMFLLLFGAKRLPEIGRSFGKGIREFKGSLAGLDDAPDAAPPRHLLMAPEQNGITSTARDIESARRLER